MSNKNPDERTVTQEKTGTNPQAAPEDQREYTGGSGVPPQAREWGADVGPRHVEQRAEDIGFETALDTRGMDYNSDFTLEDAAEPGEQERAGIENETPTDRMLRVKFNGEDREYSEEAARNMVQQYLSMQGKAPAVASQIMERLGLQDPRQLVALVAEGVKAMKSRQTGNDAGAERQEAAIGASESPSAEAGEVGEPNPMTQQQVEDQLAQLEQENGISLPDGMKNSLRVLLSNAAQVEQVAKAFPQLLSEVQNTKQTLEQQATRDRANAVNTVAKNVSTELGINTEKDFQSFMGWLDDMEGVAPGIKQRVGQDPAAMEKVIRNFAKTLKGEKADALETEMRNNVQRDASRAGGDFGVSSRSGGPGTGGQRPNFNDQMLERL